jgi:hypothetical protein
MPDVPHRHPATADQIVDALSFALRYQGRNWVNHADDMMARITADRLVQYLTASGFVLRKCEWARDQRSGDPAPSGWV